MKKIYLEKQFMKATNLNNYIIGEILSHNKDAGEYQIEKEDGTILTVFSHSLLGWEDYDERPNRAFDIDILNKITNKPILQPKGKIIYAVDICRSNHGTDVAGFTVSTIMQDGTIVVHFTDNLRGSYKGIAEMILKYIDKNHEIGREAELRVNTVGLGKGILDYLEDCPIPVKICGFDEVKQAHTKLREKIYQEEMIINETLKETLENLDNKVFISKDGCKVLLEQHESNIEQYALFSSLLMTCHNGGKFLCENEFELWIEKTSLNQLSSLIEIYHLMLRDNKTREEECVTSSQKRYEIENTMNFMVKAFGLANKKVKVHIGIKEESTK